MIVDISPANALQMLEKDQAARLVDVRTPAEYAEVHAKNAIHVPLDKLSKEALAAAGISSPDTPLLLICKSGGRSAQACQLLAAQGFTRLHNVSGGTMSWVGENLPAVEGHG